jgi:hypothetical protein
MKLSTGHSTKTTIVMKDIMITRVMLNEVAAIISVVVVFDAMSSTASDEYHKTIGLANRLVKNQAHIILANCEVEYHGRMNIINIFIMCLQKKLMYIILVANIDPQEAYANDSKKKTPIVLVLN